MTTIESRPEPRQTKPRPARSARVTGYVISAAINLAFIWLVNVAPGWRWLPILSDDFTRVVGLVTFSFVVSAGINLVYVAFDPLWMKRLGDAVTTVVAAVVLFQLLLIFPFDFGPQWAGWETSFRVLLGLGCLGTVIGVLVNFVLLLRALVTAEGRR